MKLIFIPLFFCLSLAIRFSESAAVVPVKIDSNETDLMSWYNSHKTRSAQLRDSLKIDRAVEVLDSCINLAPRNPNSISEYEKLGWIYVNRAYLYEAYRGNFHEAKKDYLSALKNFHQAQTENFLIARYLYQPLANIHTRFGENEQAIRYLELFIQIARANEQFEAELNGLNDLGRAYMNKGDYTSSEEILKSGIALSNDDFYNKGLLYSSLAESYSSAHKYELGITASLESLKAFKIARNKISENDFRYDQITRYKIGVLSTLGGLYTKTNELQIAAKHLNEAEKIAKELYPRKHRKIAKIHLAKGDNFSTQKEFTNALNEYHLALISSSYTFQNKNPQSIPKTEQLSPDVSHGEAILGKARILKQMTDSDKFPLLALEHYQKYFEWMNLNIQEQQDTYSKLVFVEEIHAVANEAIELTYLLRDKIPNDSAARLAYAFIDQSKGIILSQTQQTLKYSKTENDSEFRLLRDLSNQLTEFQRELKDAEMQQNQSRITSLKREIAHLDQEKQLVGFSISQRHPSLQSSRYRYNVKKTLHQLSNLEHNECLVNYFEGDRYYFSVVVKNGSFELQRHSETINEELLAVLSVFHENTSITPKEYSDISYSLYSQLCPKSIRSSHLNHWIVIPDGRLHLLPFEALTYSSSSEHNWKRLKYLVKRRVISYAPTTTSLFTDKKTTLRGTFSGFAPTFEPSKKLPELTHSTKEVRTANDIFSGKSYYKKNATKEVFAQALTKQKIVHVSTHAGADTVQTSDSWLALQGKTKLTTSDILNLEVEADLVVLNACETGAGKYAAGEGILSLARSFLASGSNCVVTNLYQANHGINADLFGRFYQQLIKVKSPAVAMQKAKLNYLKDQNTDSRSAHPRNWATPVVIGNVSKIAIEGNAPSENYMLWLLLIPIVLLGFLVLRYLKLRKTKTVNT